jgi:DNA polymerase
MRYRDVKTFSGLTAVIPRMGKMMRLGFWGGTLVENLVQATSRDIFMDRVLRLKEAGLPPILRVHDEAVCLLPTATAEQDLQKMVAIMSAPPEWMSELPLGAAGHLCKRYSKE